MASNAMCGLNKLSKANLAEMLGLLGIDANDYTFDRKDNMASFVYDSIVGMHKKNKKFKKEIENLKQQIDDMDWLEDY